MTISHPTVKNALARNQVTRETLTKKGTGFAMKGSSRAGNVYDANCPTRLVLDRVADKWSVLVLGLLAQEPIRFNELRRRIDGISQKMLAQVLRQLERDGLINRKVTPTVPVTVEYSITPLGRTLSKTVGALSTWAEKHFPDVLRAQQAYDRQAAR